MIADLKTGFELELTHRVMTAFPMLPDEFGALLYERFKVNEFSEKEMTTAIERVIDGCTETCPPVALFLQSITA